MFPFKFDKAVQAVAILLRGERSKRTNYMRLIKLLYIADRESLQERGAPIVGGRVIAVERGPVLSSVLDLVKGHDTRCQEWNRFFRRDGYHLELVRDPELGALSKYDIDKLNEVSDRHRCLDEYDVMNITHTYEEWKRNFPSDPPREIALREILEAIERSKEDIDAIEKEAKASGFYDRFFGS